MANNKGSGKVFLIVGKRKTGKSTLARRMCEKLPHRICTYQFHGSAFAGMSKKVIYFDSKAALINAGNKHNGCVFFFDDATSYMSTSGVTLEFMRVLARSRDSNNVVILAFHSLRKVPLDVFEMADTLFLFNTSDSLSRVTEKYEDFPEVIAAFTRRNSGTINEARRYAPEVVKVGV